MPNYWVLWTLRVKGNPKKLETGLRTNSAGIPYTLLLRIELFGFQLLGFYHKLLMQRVSLITVGS